MKKCPPPVAPGDGLRIPHERQLAMKNTTLLRPRLLVAVGAAFALTLSGCAVDTPTKADRVVASTTVAPAAPAVESPADRTDAVLQSVAADEGIHMPDGMAGEYATIICEGLDDGLSLTTLVRIGVDALPRWDSGQHAFLIGASIGAKCPEYAHVVGGVA